MLNYATHIKDGSMFNTPPVFPILMMNETLKWVKSQGGAAGMYKKNVEKAAILYDEIDRNKVFTGTAEKEDRSLMNICFVMNKGYESKEEAFLNFAKERGMVGIKGHRSVGGFRASTYNACPKSSVEALVQCMQEFEKSNV
jgi:phosphoserine aminotransferase